LPKLYKGNKTISREADSINKRERGVKQMNICQFCGWEVKKPEWYNYYNKKPLCDDCNMDMSLERERENANG